MAMAALPRMKKKNLHFDLEAGPFSPINPCHTQNADQTGGHRGEGIYKSGAQLEGEDGDLPGDPNQIRQRSHDGHGQGSLSGVGGDKQVLKQLWNRYINSAPIKEGTP